MSRLELAVQLGVSPSTVSNYEGGTSFPREDVLTRMFDILQTDPNTLFQDSFFSGQDSMNSMERQIIRQFRKLNRNGKESVKAIVDGMCAVAENLEGDFRRAGSHGGQRQIPVYRTPAAAGCASPVYGEDFDYLVPAGDVPMDADYAVRIQGDSMMPWVTDGSVVYVSRDTLRNGDVGIFFLGEDIFCGQYYRDMAGNVFLFSLNRAYRDADVSLPANSGRLLVCFGRVLLDEKPPLPAMAGQQ